MTDKAVWPHADHMPRRACCGTTPDMGHLPTCRHYCPPADLIEIPLGQDLIEIPLGTRCSECGMGGFHVASCPLRTVDVVSKPSHYNSHPSGVEIIEVIRHMTLDGGNAFKYVLRAGEKGNLADDLKKSRWYIADCVEHKDPLFINSIHRAEALPLIERMIHHESDEKTREFLLAVRSLDLDWMAEAVDEMRLRQSQTESGIVPDSDAPVSGAVWNGDDYA